MLTRGIVGVEFSLTPAVILAMMKMTMVLEVPDDGCRLMREGRAAWRTASQ
jgi:hypothetical protein